MFAEGRALRCRTITVVRSPMRAAEVSRKVEYRLSQTCGPICRDTGGIERVLEGSFHIAVECLEFLDGFASQIMKNEPGLLNRNPRRSADEASVSELLSRVCKDHRIQFFYWPFSVH